MKITVKIYAPILYLFGDITCQLSKVAIFLHHMHFVAPTSGKSIRACARPTGKTCRSPQYYYRSPRVVQSICLPWLL